MSQKNIPFLEINLLTKCSSFSRKVLSHLEDARVVAVLRGGNPQRLYKRGMELSAMPGCGAVEVALDTPGALEALRALSKDLPSSVIVGAATVVRLPLPTSIPATNSPKTQ